MEHLKISRGAFHIQKNPDVSHLCLFEPLFKDGTVPEKTDVYDVISL